MRYLIVLFLLLFSCTEVSQEKAVAMLDIILKDDMAAIVDGVDKKYLLDSTYYKIVSIKKYDKSKYQYNAIVDFYFLNDSTYYIERKFRFNREYGKWERYYNEYKSY